MEEGGRIGRERDMVKGLAGKVAWRKGIAYWEEGRHEKGNTVKKRLWITY